MTDLWVLEMVPDPSDGRECGTAMRAGTQAEMFECLRGTARTFPSGKWLDDNNNYRVELEIGWRIFRVSQVLRGAETLFPQTVPSPLINEE
ncbi:hypothetical protein ACIBCN_18620 [Nocardia sp. NPDC051052]|uniref:hypothetical protein n=1 Tax=Nocardia sp. NPDC051052 TaxID=3364322 RepID=UPI0037A2D482